MSRLLLTFLGVVYFGQSLAQSNHIFMSYNLLNYENEDDREDDFVTILEYVDPDVIITQEVIGTDGYNHFQTDVLDVLAPGEWSGAPFINQSASQDIALFYRQDIFSFISTALVDIAQSSSTRDGVEWIIAHNESGVQFNVYGVHFKANSGTTNATQRLAEAIALREYLDDLPAGSHFLVAGDFNIYSNNSSTEPAFDMLTGPGDDEDGQLFDPVDRIGHWHNNSSFADVHTQSSRGGSFGGLDDRFDWIFVSAAVLTETYELNYNADSYWAIGNDGNHFNQAINDGNNTSVDDSIANALYAASDHLPVMAEFSFPGGNPSPYEIVITEVMVNPAAVSDAYGEWFELYNNDTTAINISGWQIADRDDDFYQIVTVTEFFIAPGDYLVLGRNIDSAVNGGYQADYEYSGFQLGNSADEILLIDEQNRLVDEIDYDNSFPYSSGASMYLTHVDLDNSLDSSWAMSAAPYGDGDFGTPGRAWDDTLSTGADFAFTADQFILYPAYPNPFNPTTTIRFMVGRRCYTSLQIYDLNGRLVDTLVNDDLEPGLHEVLWTAAAIPSGMYFARFTSGRSTQIQKLILLK